MKKPIERTKITIIDPDASDDAAIIRKGTTAIDLRIVQAAIDGRRNNDLSWLGLTSAISKSLTIDGEKATWKQLARQVLVPASAAANGADTLTTGQRANFKAGNPISGLADIIIQHFCLGENFLSFQNVLRDTESHSIVRGQTTVARQQLAQEALHIEALEKMRADQALDVPITDYVLTPRPQSDGLTFVMADGNSEGVHHTAHKKAGELGFVPSNGGSVFDRIRQIRDGVRAGNGWEDFASATKSEKGGLPGL